MRPQPELLEAQQLPNAQEWWERGVKIGRIYTDYGLPIDMAISRMTNATKLQKIQTLNGALWWLIEHRRQSNATDKALDRQRAANRESMRRFIESGESGVY